MFKPGWFTDSMDRRKTSIAGGKGSVHEINCGKGRLIMIKVNGLSRTGAGGFRLESYMEKCVVQIMGFGMQSP